MFEEIEKLKCKKSNSCITKPTITAILIGVTIAIVTVVTLIAALSK